ncbi:MAG: helix-turn-helix domain-containing protein [Corynebacterium sp.]|nr:helix-turn-helix domain-containing protein [Corynebacterium sp.]
MPVVSAAELSVRRQEILEGARACFATYGYEGATVRRLEQATGKSRGAIFHHFGDKENLFLALAREDAARMADVVAESGLVQVMRELIDDPQHYEWLSTRLEILTLLRTDAEFRALWQQHQAVLDTAVRQRLEHNAALGRVRDDVPLDVLHSYLEIVFDGFLARLGSGAATEDLEAVLDVVEGAIRIQAPANANS